MAMNVGPVGGTRDPEVMIDINTTPLIDVMLVLLVMLIITIPIQLHSVNLNMPVGNPPPPPVLPEVVKIDIAPTGTIDWDGKTEPGSIFWNGEAMPDRLSLLYRLQEASKQPVQPELHLRPDKASKYELTAGVMASAQRFGLTKIGIVGSEQFVDE
jgi:biopolymer transport protein ExbD